MSSSPRPMSVRVKQLEVNEDLVLIAAPEADRVRELLEDAVRRKDFETIRREGHHWSGSVGLRIFDRADAVSAQEVTSDESPS